MSAPLRVAVALSGGVDSSVVALLLSRCVKTMSDVEAIRAARPAPPPLTTVMDAVLRGAPITTWAASCTSPVPCTESDRPVVLAPLYMKNWEDVEAANGWCLASLRDYEDATAVARSLGLVHPLHTLRVVNLAAEYVESCFDPMLTAYARGHTLNVDVLCNEHIKFGHLWQQLRHSGQSASRAPPGEADAGMLPMDRLATGHYARTWRPSGDAGHSPDYALVQRPFSAATDLNDQTVFLSRVPSHVLANALFPLGHLFASKSDVRDLARWWWREAAPANKADSDSGTLAARLHHLTDKKTSTGICFVGPPSRRRERSARAPNASSTRTLAFARFLNEYVQPDQATALAAGRPCQQSSANSEEAATRGAAHVSNQTKSETQRTLTVFKDADTGADLDPSNFTWSFSCDGLVDYAHNYLPAFAFTLGQKLLYAASPPSAPDGGAPPSMKSRRLHHHYYVWKKELVPHSNDVVVPRVARLQTVWLVSRWDDARLFSRHVHLDNVCVHLPLSALSSRFTPAERTAVAALPGHTDEVVVRGWCCSRHLEELRPATFRLKPPSPHRRNACVTCLVDLDEPVRALTPGQALVMYVAPDQLDAFDASYPKGTARPDSSLVVIASGWVTGSAERS